MRTALSSLLPLLGLCACSVTPRPYIDGTVSYTAASGASSTSGALPLRALACGGGTRVPSLDIQLGDHCLLRGPIDTVGRGARMAGFTVRLASKGACALPGTAGEVLSLQTATATFQTFGEMVDTNVGGMTSDGRYVTYRFTGSLTEGPETACDALEGVTRSVTDGTSLVAQGREAWETWVPEPQGSR